MFLWDLHQSCFIYWFSEIRPGFHFELILFKMRYLGWEIFSCRKTGIERKAWWIKSQEIQCGRPYNFLSERKFLFLLVSFQKQVYKTNDVMYLSIYDGQWSSSWSNSLEIVSWRKNKWALCLIRNSHRLKLR